LKLPGGGFRRRFAFIQLSDFGRDTERNVPRRERLSEKVLERKLLCTGASAKELWGDAKIRIMKYSDYKTQNILYNQITLLFLKFIILFYPKKNDHIQIYNLNKIITYKYYDIF